ncbi:Zinc carboxypeptidase [Oryzisolibacter propanilivorax]|uniref:Zinc carboxypeptidase n=1 Tax=Oryzisolibacter propanilivorax TaxID=1527607 RepID=A0A1G9SRD3_9BURK|nr:M14 family zinc carboxypeptidase [Oryzisolibacter propanilivorax]SDM38016.1 Zinc carboxypeptidase [Oryzisolibacter propanilivorax]
MTTTPPTARRTRLLRPARLSLLTLASVLLAACSSTPLPPWPGQPPARSVPGRVVPPPLSQPAPDVGAQVTVTPIDPATPLPDAVAPQPASPLDARFPAPTVRYDTPGLADGRGAFTTNAELQQWLRQLAAESRGVNRSQVLEYGRSQRGQPLLALVLTRAPGTDVAALEASGRPTVLLMGQQHGDEPASAEALLVIARELATGPLQKMLDGINVIVVPRTNPDGAEAGQPLTVSGIDLDHDHLLLRTPEAQSLALLVRNYRPIALLDAHEYPVRGLLAERAGVLPRADLLAQPASTANLPEFMTRAAMEWYHQPMVQALQQAGLTQDWYFRPVEAEGGLHLAMGGTGADSARNVNGLKNAVSLRIDSRGSDLDRQQLQRRVHAQVTAIASMLRSTVERASNLEEVRSYEAREIASQACRGELVVRAQGTPLQRELLAIDPQTGADRPLHLQWDSTLQLRPTLRRARPCGYWLSASAGDAVQRLRWMGLQVLRVAEPGSVLSDLYEQQPGSDRGEGLRLTTRRAAIDVPEGSYYVPMNQPLANLAAAALEPDTRGSYYAHQLIGGLQDTARVMVNPPLVFEEMD